jgi:hypothetical protein
MINGIGYMHKEWKLKNSGQTVIKVLLFDCSNLPLP